MSIMVNFYQLWSMLLVFMLGASTASFINVVALRLGTGLSIIKGASACPTCNKSLKWFELVPVFSFLLLSGRCSRCKSRISPRYLVLEILMGFFAVILFINVFSSSYFYNLNNILIFAYYFFIFNLLLTILLYDLKHKIIPNRLILIFIILAPVNLFLSSALGIFDMLAGFILALPFAILWLVSSGRWIGLGDAKLALGIGLFLGISGGIASVLLAFWIGAIFSIMALIWKKILENNIVNNILGLNYSDLNITMKSEIPFAPFLILGLSISFFFSVGVEKIIFFFSWFSKFYI